MSLIEDMRIQDALYWEAIGINSRSNYTFANPIEIKVRWQDGQVMQTGTIEDVTYDGAIFVDRDMPKGSRLMLGVLEDLKAALPPPDAAKQVRKSSKIPDFDAEEYLYKVMF